MKKIRNMLLVIGFLIGLGILLYPTISNKVAVKNQIHVVQSYNQYVSGMSQAQIEEEKSRAKEYNTLLKAAPATDPFSNVDHVEPFTQYDTILNLDGVMGSIEIPSIKVKLPIYHGVTDEVLRKGVGHIRSTALPIGGNRTHAVLSAHSGLPKAKLFTDLEKVKEKDYFYIYVLGEKLAYQVDQISVVEPDDISNLTPVEGKDYVTLVTCTPIGVNSHRLLVRGERCEVPELEEVLKDKDSFPYWFLLLLLIIVLLIFIIYKKKKKSNQTKDEE